MKKYLNKIMIVDGSYMLHRSLKTPDLCELSTSDGIKSGGIFGFLRILQAEMKKFPSYFPIVCWDKGLSSRRINLYPDYKANRKRQEVNTLLAAGLPVERDEYLEEYKRQRNDLIEILKSFGIPSLLIPGWEGDDLQYIISKSCNEGIVISDDRDMIQLLSPTIKIRRSLRKEILEFASVEEELKYPQFVIAKSIMGDKSDNIPKVAEGVGDKTADKIAQLLKSRESLAFTLDETLEYYRLALEEYVEKNTDTLSKKIQNVLGNFEQFEINYQLINLQLVESPPGFEEMLKRLILTTINNSNMFNAYRLIGRYEMTTIYPDQIIGMLSLSSTEVILNEETM